MSLGSIGRCQEFSKDVRNQSGHAKEGNSPTGDSGSL